MFFLPFNQHFGVKMSIIYTKIKLEKYHRQKWCNSALAMNDVEDIFVRLNRRFFLLVFGIHSSIFCLSFFSFFISKAKTDRHQLI